MASSSSVQRQYDRWAPVYDALWGRYARRTLRVLDAWAAAAPHEAVLDVGCGTGAFEARLLARYPSQRITGVDLSARMVAVAREKLSGYPSAAFVQAPASALPFADGAFDVVVSASVFHYFEDPHAALGEMQRVLRPGGRLVLLDWCRDFWTCRVMDAVLTLLDPAHRTCYTLADLLAMLRHAGLAVRRFERFRLDLIWGLMITEAAPRPPSGAA